MPERHGAPVRPGPAQMLEELLADPLDPGYRLAAERRSTHGGPPRRSRTLDRLLTAVGVVAVGLVLVIAYQQTHRSAPARDAVQKDLVGRIRAQQAAASALADSARALASTVGSLRDQNLAVTPSALAGEEIVQGAVAVHGPGVRIRLTEPAQPSASAPARGGTVAQPTTSVITDLDIRSVVNELWAAGAEAVDVNGIRLTPTSFIRFAGAAVTIDYQPVNSPYVVSAIGDRNGLQVAFAESAIARTLKTKQDAQGIGFSVSGESELSLPAAAAPAPDYASTGIASPDPSASSTPSGAQTSPHASESPS